MRLTELKTNMKVLLATGDSAQVVALNESDQTVEVLYLDALGEPHLVGTRAWLSCDEVISLDSGGHVEGNT